MKKAFTLIELLVTISIIAIMVAISVPILANQKNRAKNLDTATSVAKDAILAAQNYAFAPERLDAQHYVINFNITDKSYSVYWTDDQNNAIQASKVIKPNIPLYGNVNLQPIFPPGSFGLAFRVSDGAPGFIAGNQIVYPNGGPDFEIRLRDANGNSKRIKVQSVTGEVHVE